MTPEYVLRTFDVKRQARDAAYRAACLETLEAGDVIQAIHPETGAVVDTRLLVAVDWRWDPAVWPQRYFADDWGTDAEGYQLDEGQERVPWGWVLVRPPLTHQKAQALLAVPPPRKPAWSWAMYEKHLKATHDAVLHGFPLPEEPWA